MTPSPLPCPSLRSVLRLVVLLTLSASAAALAADAWPHLRGPHLDGSSALGESPALPGDVAFEPVWRRPLGSGYSSIVAAEGRGYTMATIDGRDRLLAFDLESGADLYRHDLGEVFPGRDGSEDGPLSTPTYVDGVLFVLAPRGELSARRAEDGSIVWSVSLSELGAPEPAYGFSTTPLVVDDLVVVATGAGDGAALSAFDRATGELRWQAGNGDVQVQIPTLATLGGRRQVLSSTSTEMFGVEIGSGRLLWRHGFDEPKRWNLALAYPELEDHVLVTHDRGAMLFRVASEGSTDAGSGVEVTELWSERHFRANGGSPRTPILRDGLLFAHTDRFLHAVSVETGERVWRSRPPGGRNLIALGRHLLVVGAGGDLVAVRADGDGYRETGRVAAGLGYGVVTPPSVVGDLVLVRDLREMAVFRIGPAVPADAGEAPASSAVTSVHLGRDTTTEPVGRVARLIDRLERGADGAEIDRFLAEVGELPWIEDDVVHFLARGSFEELAVEGDMTGLWDLAPMQRVGDSDLFQVAFRLDGARRLRYRFLEFDEPHLDPHNADRVEEEGVEYSLWRAGDEGRSELFAEPAEPRRRVVAHREFPRSEGRAPFAVTTSIPRGPAPEGGFPLMIVLRGSEAIADGRWPDLLENLTRDGADQGVAVAFFHLPDAAWFLVNAERVDSVFRDQFLPYLDETFDLTMDRDRWLVVGQGLAGASALHFAIAFDGWGGRVAVQSPRMGASYRAQVWPTYLEAEPLDVWLDWGRRDGFDVDTDLDVARDAAHLAEHLRGGGHEVLAVESDGGHDWERWGEQLPAILRHFFGEGPDPE